MTVLTCRACCQTGSLEPILEFGKVPLAGGFLSSLSATQGESKYDLTIHCCHSCGLVQISDAIDPEILFQDYSFSSSTVGPLVQHFQAYATWIHERFLPKRVLEFGCNDGILLGPLEALGIQAVGVDPSENITDLAKKKGYSVFTGYFDQELAGAVVSEFGLFDVVTGSNAFAHNANPEKIIQAAIRVLKPGGALCLEVMYAGDLLEQWQWDTLYHEHLTFYSLQTLQTLLQRFEFKMVHAERLSMHGGSLRIVATRDHSVSASDSLKAVQNYEENLQLNAFKTWKNFGQAVRRRIQIVQQVLPELAKSKSIWGYGAAGKATMWLNLCNLNFLKAVVDASPLRAGKYMPGTHTPIVSPDKLRELPPDYIFVTAWNYAPQIAKNESWYQGTWVTPLPQMRFF